MIIAVASQKGGTGKTSTSISLAAGLARKNKRVLLVDIDSQANSSKVLLPHYMKVPVEETVVQTIIKRKPLPIHPTTVPNLDIAPAHILLSTTDVELTTALDHREERLKRELDKVAPAYDFVFIDCPPALGWLTINAFTAAEKVLIVVSPGYFELDSIVQINKTIAQVRQDFNPKLEVLGQTYTELVCHTVIPRNTDLRDAHFSKQDVFSYNPNASAAHAYNKLIA